MNKGDFLKSIFHSINPIQECILNYFFRSSPAGTVTQDDILDITDKLHEDFRFKALDRLDPDRKLMLFQVNNVLVFSLLNTVTKFSLKRPSGISFLGTAHHLELLE